MGWGIKMKKILFLSILCSSLLFGGNYFINDDITLKNNIAYLKSNGKKFDGVINEFYETGELMGEKTYKFGMIVDMKTYKISGALASVVTFKNGKAIGGKIFYENVKKDRAMTHADFMRYKLAY
jgi:antitoxin component YwqK of YwqJK toxin-antitoxin module